VDNVLTVFSPFTLISLMETTGVAGCLGLELGLASIGDACMGLGCLVLFFAVASSGFAEMIGVEGWLELDPLGDVATGLALFGVAT